MTDKEIIKALEGAILNAKGCDSKVWSIEIYKLESALDLINLQKAEIEFLKEKRDQYMQDATDFSIKVEQLKTENELLKMAGDA